MIPWAAVVVVVLLLLESEGIPQGSQNATNSSGGTTGTFKRNPCSRDLKTLNMCRDFSNMSTFFRDDYGWDASQEETFLSGMSKYLKQPPRCRDAQKQLGVCTAPTVIYPIKGTHLDQIIGIDDKRRIISVVQSFKFVWW